MAAEREVAEAAERALAAPRPAPETVMRHVTSEDVDPASDHFDSPSRPSGPPKTMVDLLNACLQDEMARDPRIVVFGEDVADCSREEHIDEVKGKGASSRSRTTSRGARLAARLQLALAEAAIIGARSGSRCGGSSRSCEIQFFDYIWPAMMQLRNELATLRWRSNGAFKCPVVVRVAIGAT